MICWHHRGIKKPTHNLWTVIAVTHCLWWQLTHCLCINASLFLNRKAELSETSAVLEAFKFIENAAAEFSDEDEEEDSEGRDRTNVESRTVRNPHLLHLQNDNRRCCCTTKYCPQYLSLRSWGRSPHRQRHCLPVWTPVRTLTQRRHWRALTSCPALMRWTPRRSPEAMGMAQIGVSHGFQIKMLYFLLHNDEFVSWIYKCNMQVTDARRIWLIILFSNLVICFYMTFNSLQTVHGILVIHISCCGHKSWCLEFVCLTHSCVISSTVCSHSQSVTTMCLPLLCVVKSARFP